MAYPPQRISQEWTVDAPPELVWNVLGHTDRLNRESGLPSVQMSSFEDDDIGRPVRATLYGILPLRWTEYPFEWVRGANYAVQRDYTEGPIERFRGGVEVEPNGSGTKVRMFAELTPRNWLGKLAIPLVGRDTMNKARAYCTRAVARLRSGQAAQTDRAARLGRPSDPGPVAAPRASRADDAVLQQRARRLESLAQLDRAVVERLVVHLRTGDDDEVLRMQPYALAARWGTDRHETLRVFLYATRAGLLSLQWELMCPNCRVPKGEQESLAQVTARFHCDTCGIDCEANLDRSVELRFKVHPSIRDAKDAVFCFGGPYSAPHILVQHLLRPGERRDLSVTLGDEAYRLRVLRLNHTVLLEPATAQAADHRPTQAVEPFDVVYRDDGWTPSALAFRPGSFALRWTNATQKTLGVVLERVQWDDQAVSAAKVSALQEFRDLFGAEVLAPGQDIGVESVTVLFSDLKESTRLYEESGDAPAYGHVRRHFDFLKERIARHHGAIVKTIGDAVMAVFHQPADGLRCVLAIQRELRAFNDSLPDRPPLVIKLGLHHGPAIAINANGLLDYFGRTVNVASRVLRESTGGDVVFPKDYLDDPRAAEALAAAGLPVEEEWTATLRGLAQPLALCRVKM